jgi:hypothetical protein
MQLARSCRGAMVALAALGAALVAVGSAQADTKRISDGNDRPGRLDIRSASHAHDGGRVVHTISTFSRWRPGLVAATRLPAPTRPRTIESRVERSKDTIREEPR